ncbi:MAG: Na(+)/H(+) antiporter subunit B [Minwuiales bacterium]|nr:Na(+)/H(+) antiporter subunit B [Minwuiales bacterium]
MIHHLIPRVVVKLLIPFILLFGLYVQFHGDFGPGGGFQAGVIFASAFILYAMLFGVDHAQRVFPAGFISLFVAGGLILYAGVGFAGIALGGNYLDYNVLAHDPVHGQHRGILWIELGVGITVAAVIVKIFYMFSGRGRD